MKGSLGSDDQLARRCAAGDQEAFAEIYRRHHQGLYRYCLSILRNPEDALDALQAAMENALRAMSTQRVDGGLRPWLYRIAHNESISLASRRERPSADPTPAIGSDGADGERLEQLIADLGTLPLQQRSALVLRELSGLGADEIGSALEISPSAAKQSIYEARVALRQLGEGRDMNCQRVQRKISDGDGRQLRGRRVKAHLGDCAICRNFQGSISGRRSDLGVLFPLLGAAAAAKTLAAITQGGSSSAAADSSSASAGSAAVATPHRYRRGAVLAGLLAVLGAGAAIGLLPSDEPAGGAGAPGQSQSDGPRADAAPRHRPPPPRSAARPAPNPDKGPSASPTPSGVAGYSAIEPAALQALGGSGSDDRSGSRSGSAGAGGSHGAGGRQAGDGLAFTGLDLGLLLLAGASLLALGALTRRLARPSA